MLNGRRQFLPRESMECIFRQLRLYGHVARLPAEDPAHRILSCRDPRGWTMPSGRPHASWLRQVESYIKDTGMTGLASARAMARRRPKEYRHKVDAATHCPASAPIPHLNAWKHSRHLTSWPICTDCDIVAGRLIMVRCSSGLLFSRSHCAIKTWRKHHLDSDKICFGN